MYPDDGKTQVELSAQSPIQTLTKAKPVWSIELWAIRVSLLH